MFNRNAEKSRNMNIVVFTEYGSNYDAIADVTIPVMDEYCKHQGYGFAIKFLPEGGNEYPYKKHEFIQTLFKKGYDLAWYLDVDAMVTNFNYRIEEFIDEKHHLFITKDFNELNGGSLIIKNTDIGKVMNNMILAEREKYDNEQNVINALMGSRAFSNFVKVLPHPSINSYRYDLYPECIKCVGNKNLGDWEVGCFVLHVPALPIWKRVEILKNTKIVK